MKLTVRTGAAALAVLVVVAAGRGVVSRAQTDALASWNDGPAKRAIVDLVARVTREGGPDFVPMPERVATFDNDGTLWAEKPLPTEIYFVLSRVRELAARDPSLAARQPFKAALEGDVAYFHEAGARAIVELVGESHTGMAQESFAREVDRFFQNARHPTLHRPYGETGYQPMAELLTYLRASGFDVWICSGGTTDFMREIAPRIYDVPRDHVIGSDVRRESRVVDGRLVVWRLPGPALLNDKEMKPLTIDRQIGRRPLLASGNVGAGGDVAMLEYSKGRAGRSLQLLVNHDDADREFAYAEKTNESLEAARRNGFTVVSVRTDWKTIFAPARTPPG
jgi:phosphoserine phosphatase